MPKIPVQIVEIVISNWDTICTGLTQLINALRNNLSREPERPASDAIYERIRRLDLEKAELEAKLAERKAELEDERERRLLEKEKLEAKLAETIAELEETRKVLSQRQVRRTIVCIDKSKFNYGITGWSGVGKSALINALCKITDGDQDGAEVSQITNKMTPYCSSKVPRLVFWDMPGAGTQDYPVKNYYEDNALFDFDAILIVIDGRIREVDVQLAKQAIECQKPVAFVLSKADMLICDRAKRLKMEMKPAADSFRREMMDMLKRTLDAANLCEIKLFIVSSYAFCPDELLPSLSPYINITKDGEDGSLKQMDETLLFQFISKVAEERFSTVRPHSIMNEQKPHLIAMDAAT